MAIAHRILDTVFRALDAVDAARARVGRALGHQPKPDPWAAEWKPEEPAAEREPQRVPASPPSRAVKAASPPSGAAKSAPPAHARAKPAASKKKAAPKSGAGRKGSVDRSGKDFDSPRARAITDHLNAEGVPVLDTGATLDGKKVLARVVWALSVAAQAGVDVGLTAADISAVLSTAAGLEVYATNIARTCRDEDALIAEGEPEGRPKRYRLTAAGTQKARELPLRPAPKSAGGVGSRASEP